MFTQNVFFTSVVKHGAEQHNATCSMLLFPKIKFNYVWIL